MIKSKTPIKYYGGKQKVAKWVISHFPKHDCYVEAFAGGLAVFFARVRKVKAEVINDKNSFVFNFYKQYRDNPQELIRVLEATPYSREEYDHCHAIYNGKLSANELEKARAFFVLCWQSYAANMDTWGTSKTNSQPDTTGRRVELLKMLTYRLRQVYIENRDALKVIDQWDGPNTFFYLDPPYPITDQRGYRGTYTLQDFNKLLSLLKGIKGKFLLSCYLKKGMEIAPEWNQSHRETICHAQKTDLVEKREKRMETLIYNYNLRRSSNNAKKTKR